MASEVARQMCGRRPRTGRGFWRRISEKSAFCCNLLAALVYAAGILTPAAGHAAVTARDMEVAGRILALTSNPLTGNVRVGIVYDPSNDASSRDERDLADVLSGGVAVGDINLIPVPISISDISAEPTDILFLTSGLGAAAAAAGAQAAREKILCITTDLAATKAGYCALSLQIDTKVHITINQAALAASNVSFSEAFMLMVNEI
jgi:hypothetical protein